MILSNDGTQVKLVNEVLMNESSATANLNAIDANDYSALAITVEVLMAYEGYKYMSMQ